MEDNGFGIYLRTLREEKGLSQFQLGKLVGVTDKAVSKWENGYAKPKNYTVMKLSEVLSVSVEDLLFRMYSENKGV